MGVTAWVGRYRLPNALETLACEWELPEAPSETPPAQRLQELLDDTPSSVPERVAERNDARPPPKPRRGRARALLGIEEPPAEDDATSPPVDEPPVPAAKAPLQEDENARQDARDNVLATSEALRFSLQVAALEGRWMAVLPVATAPGADMQRLLVNLLRAAGIALVEPPAFQTFHWPMMEELPVEAPLAEARDGLRAFVEGRRRDGWRPERLLVFGSDPALERVLAVTEGYCPLLDLPAWQGPSLVTLGTSADDKRALLPCLAEWRAAWLEDVGNRDDSVD